MKTLFSFVSLASAVSAQYTLESLSFGHEKGISPNRYAIPGWHISGEGHNPQQMSDKVILTPPYPGNRRGALWTDAKVPHSEWIAEFEFRAGGPEHGGGNLQVWYTKEGQTDIGTSSVYTVGKFDGLVLVVDMHGGKGGSIRGFLNDGSTDYKNHHHIDALSFGHCDYSYRNLGRPSRIQLKQDAVGFEVSVDDQRCFRSDEIKLPNNNHFGITAASSETPDSFEVFKFIVKTSNAVSREEPRREKPAPIENQGQGSQQASNEDLKDTPASSIKSQDAQFADLHNRLQVMNHAMDNLFREITKISSATQARQQDFQQNVGSGDQLKALDERLQKIESGLEGIRKETKDYTMHFQDLHNTLKYRHDTLLESLPDAMGHIISSRSPRMGFFIFLLVIFQLMLAGSPPSPTHQDINDTSPHYISQTPPNTDTTPKTREKPYQFPSLSPEKEDYRKRERAPVGRGGGSMVLFKRKPVQYVSPPPMLDDQEVWPIEETNEIFTNYDAYLARMDFYKQKRFICEITGHSGLDFFDALRNEIEASSEVNDAFPDSLREPILRKVQFSTISRIDNLVDHIFEEFKQDFYPGESVTVILDNGDRLNGIVREKTKFPELIQPDGTLERKAFARYFVSLTGRPDEEALVDEEHIARDRKTFTKQMLRSFLRNSVHRDAWTGAPWLVKGKLAHDYRINTEIPLHLRYEHQVAQRKVNLNIKKGECDGPAIVSFFPGQSRLPELKPKSHKSKYLQQGPPRSRQEQFLDYQRALAGNPAFGFDHGIQLTNEAQFIQYNDHHPGYPAIAAKGIPKPAPPPPIKYPIEDLEIPPARNSSHRPELKFLSQGTHTPHQPSEGTGYGILMSSVGPLLETWDTLNVYCEVFLLDSFTFDDYIEALQFTSEDVHCELLAEIHCAVLKKLVNDEKDLNGQVQVVLPAALQEDSDEEESRENSKTPMPEPEIKPRTTRSSVAKSEATELKVAAAIDAKLHRAAEIDQSMRGYDWRFRLRKRDFKNGRWIVIVVGLLNLLTRNPRLRKRCDEILVKLAPLDMPPTEETAISQYMSLDINTRVMILQIICMLSLETQAIRSYMEECTGLMTQVRKEKIDQQRARKALVEQLRVLHEERKALQPEDKSPVPELEELEELEDSKMNEVEDDEEIVMESGDEEPIRGRSLRRANDRAAERKRKLEEDRERKEKAEAEKAKKPTKQARQLEKVLKKIEDIKGQIKKCELEITTYDNDLRENDCPRTRVLGKDRFWNRYYWMERNAMPYGGLPDSSTANAGYANGRIWVQGPDDLERQGFIELADNENAQYRRAFNMSVPERKTIEEGPTHTITAHEWGYYDDPDQLDRLIDWLDTRGNREAKLRKELQAQRGKITTYMEKRKEYLRHAGEKKLEVAEPVSRISTRTKTYVDQTGHRCLAWKNLTAMKELGYIHSNPIPRKAQNARNAKKGTVVEDEGRQTRASNRSGKPLTRQGSRYDF